MWAMRRRTYTWLTTSLIGLSCVLLFGSIFTVRWLEHADFLVRFAMFPGGMIAAGIVFLINGCVEHYADVLPKKYRVRQNTRPEWQSLYDNEQMYAVESVLKHFVELHGFKEADAFQFRPEDRLEELLQGFYPGRHNTEALLRKLDMTTGVVDTASPARLSLREYVDARIGRDYRRADGAVKVPEQAAEQRAGAEVIGAIDRQSRNRLANAINRYLDGAMTAFAFDGEIFGILHESKDATVEYAVRSLWYHYDDCKDHLAGLSKVEWDYFQRLILLLESDAEIERVSQRKWSIRQLVAGLGLIGFGLCVYKVGIGWHLFGFALAFGPISIALSYWRNRSEMPEARKRIDLVPFSSFSELRATRKTVAGFSKRRYPAGYKTRNVHSRLMTTVVWFQTCVLWSFISPLILLFQVLPEKELETRIRQRTV
jgi:hypothetical protein